jgi:hypothetical protein
MNVFCCGKYFSDALCTRFESVLMMFEDDALSVRSAFEKVQMCLAHAECRCPGIKHGLIGGCVVSWYV